MAIFSERDIVLAPVKNSDAEASEMDGQRLIYYEPFGNFDMAVTENDDGEGSFIFFKQGTLDIAGFYSYGILDTETIKSVTNLYITMMFSVLGSSPAGLVYKDSIAVNDALTIALDPVP